MRELSNFVKVLVIETPGNRNKRKMRIKLVGGHKNDLEKGRYKEELEILS